MKNKYTTHYYLKVNDEYIIDFSCIPEFKDMTDYLRLNLFTGCFSSKEELIKALKKMGLIEADSEVLDLHIVRRKGNKKDGYQYSYVTDSFIFGKDVPYISVGTIKDFFYKNRNNPDLIEYVVNYYRDSLEKKISWKNKSLRTFENAFSAMPKSLEREELERAIESVKNTLEKFNRELTNLQRIHKISSDLEKGSDINVNLLTEFVQRLDEFVDSEVLYYRSGKTTPNNRGLVKMAKFISRATNQFDNIVLPNMSRKNDDVIREFKAILNTNPRVHRDLKGYASKINTLDEDMDPDYYMFLDEEDFEGLISENSTSKEIESVEVDLENLEELKNRHKF